MKIKALIATSLVASSFLVTSCASTAPVGALFTDVKLPVTTTANKGYTKVGVSECTSIMNLIATGDASIEAAKKAGGITEVTHIDWEAKSTLGLISTYKCIVYGN